MTAFRIVQWYAVGGNVDSRRVGATHIDAAVAYAHASIAGCCYRRSESKQRRNVLAEVHLLQVFLCQVVVRHRHLAYSTSGNHLYCLQLNTLFTSIRIAKEFGVKLTLDHCTEGSLIADELAKEGYPAFVGPSFGNKSKIELSNKSFETPRDLHAAGVSISIITDAPVIPLQHLTMCAGFAVSAGLPYEEGWRAITINPATQIGIGDRVGSLEVGKDGDVVVWLDDPLRVVGTGAYVTVVDGKIAYRAQI